MTNNDRRYFLPHPVHSRRTTPRT